SHAELVYSHLSDPRIHTAITIRDALLFKPARLCGTPPLAVIYRATRYRLRQLRERLYGSFFFQAEDGIRDRNVTGVQTCALPIFHKRVRRGFLRLREQPLQQAVELRDHLLLVVRELVSSRDLPRSGRRLADQELLNLLSQLQHLLRGHVQQEQQVVILQDAFCVAEREVLLQRRFVRVERDQDRIRDIVRVDQFDVAVGKTETAQGDCT